MNVERSITVFSRRKREAPPEPAGEINVADEVLARAEAAVNALSAEYPEYAMRDIASLISLTNRMIGMPASARDFDEISRIAHDMRGQGSVFGYPLMTRCAGSLCRTTRRFSPEHSAIPGIIRVHIAALYAVLHCGAGATNGDAASVAGGLELLVEANLTAKGRHS